MFRPLREGAIGAMSEFACFDRWAMLAWTDIKLRYRRTQLGPFWMTLNTALMIFFVGCVWGFVFHIPMEEYLPYFAIGIVVWNFISSTVVEGCRVFLDAHHVIKSLPNPLMLYVWRLLARQVICLGHNLIFLALFWLALARPLHIGALAAIAGLVVLSIALLGAVLILGTLCARFRDIPQAVTSILQILFLVTPIIWSPSGTAADGMPNFIFYANPLYNLIEVIRSPILGHGTTALNWLGASASAVVTLTLGFLMFGRFAKRVPYWL
jgi:ABC-type polysaccharide/polyol phosphate export permease